MSCEKTLCWQLDNISLSPMPAIASSPDPANDQATRRLVTGLVLSLLAHAVLLSLRFHVPEAGLAAVTRLMVRLAPAPSEVATVPPPVPDTVVAANVEPPPVPTPAPAVSGFTVVPRRPQPVAAPAVPKPARAKATRRAPKPAKRPELALKERVITQDINKDSEFAVPQAVLDDLKADAISVREGTEKGTGMAAGKIDAASAMGNDEQAKPVQSSEPVTVVAQQVDAAIALAQERKARDEAAAAAQAVEQKRGEELARQQAAQRAEDEARQRERAFVLQRSAEEDSRRQAEIAAQAERQRMAEVQARQQQADQAAQQQAAELAREQADRLARQQAAEQARQQAERLAQQQQAERARQQAERSAQQQATELARQQAERLAQQQAAEFARQQAERLAQQRAAEQAGQQVERLAQQQAAEQARQQAERLAQQQAAEQARQQAERLAQQQAAEQARQQAERLAQQRAAEQARQQAERLAQQQAAEQARQQAQKQADEQARADRERAAADARRQETLTVNGSAAAGIGQGAIGGAGGTGKAAGSVSGVNLGSRAREMLRGLDVLGAPPPAVRQTDSGEPSRRRVSNGVERDVPLRLYVDSFRQKIERNGLLNGAQLSAERVRIDPIVSVAIRSDGSVESVMIVRSSGHADIDAAVRRIVRLNERYGVFPPNVAVQFDVIEIRRIWTFAEGLKLIEEVR
ncbi:cell envelope integrity protein TolA [Massilia terrae]|uniref:Cell envelope integrity protein TolA n=1 Tax=Massilia terrae TaxID=1811224 RepID=A0ABT2D1A9_9BURK|nr:cell envelope integrity protein TolA [Massilia terrae]